MIKYLILLALIGCTKTIQECTQENTPTKYCLMEHEKEGICTYEDMETCMEDLNGKKIQGACMASYEITFNCEERNSDIFGH